MSDSPQETPAISVVIPVHGRADLLGETLASLAQQTFRDFEVIVTDDSDTAPERAEIRRQIDDYAQRIPRLQYLFTEPRLYQAPNTNQGLAAARGKYLRILHSDDLLAPRALEIEHGLLEKYERRIGVLTHWLLRFKEEPPAWRQDPEIIFQDPARFFRLRAFAGPLPTSVIMRREIYDEIGGMQPDLRFFCDSEYFMRWSAWLHRHGLQLVELTPGLVGWRVHENHLTAQSWDLEFTEGRQTIRHWRSQSSDAFTSLVPEGYRQTFFHRADLLQHKRFFRKSHLLTFNGAWPARLAHGLRHTLSHGSAGIMLGLAAKRIRDALRRRRQPWGRLPTSPTRHLNRHAAQPLGLDQAPSP